MITITSPQGHPAKILFLDDMTERYEGLIKDMRYKDGTVHWSMTARAAIKRLEEEGPFEVICLDHDLADYHYLNPHAHDGDCGCEVAGAVGIDDARRRAARCSPSMEEILAPTPLTILHSWNSAGVDRMEGILKDSGFPPSHIVRAPFGSFRFEGASLPKGAEEL